MSGELISTLKGKVPQRAIRHLGDLPYAVTYNCGIALDIGAGNKATDFITDAAFRGKIQAISVYDITETFNSVTTAPRIDIGDGSDADYWCTVEIADGTTAQHFSAAAGTIVANQAEIIEPGDVVTVTSVAPTGGTPTGIANVDVTVLYFK